MAAIRRMEPKDYAAVYALWLSCKGMGLNSVDDSREGILRFLARNPETCLLAEEEGRIVGVILAGHDGRRAFIYHTAVAEPLRGRGIGSALVAAAEEALRKLGIVKAALVVFARNESGNAFWEKLDYTRREDLIYRNKAILESERLDT